MTLTLDDPTHPIDRPYDQRERALMPLEKLAFAQAQLADLTRAAQLQQSIVTGWANSETEVRVGKNSLLVLTEERAQQASAALHAINRDIESLSESFKELAAMHGVKLGAGPLGRAFVDGGIS
jgi:hypothetical protein